MSERSFARFTAKTFIVVCDATYSIPVSGSAAPPSQFVPPPKCGSTSAPRVPSGASINDDVVNIGPILQILHGVERGGLDLRA